MRKSSEVVEITNFLMQKGIDDPCQSDEKFEGMFHDEVIYPEKGNHRMQFIAGIGGSLVVAASVANYSWLSPALPYLKSNESKFPVSDKEGAWIISTFNLGDLLGSLLIIFLVDRIGRKFSLILSALLSLIAWIFIIFADNYIYLLIARLIAGVGQGWAYTPLVIYLSEISEKNVRGTLVSIMRILSAVVMFVLTAVGSSLSYNVLTASCLMIPLLSLMTFAFMPESPYYFLMTGRNENAMKNLMKLRGVTSSQVLLQNIREMKLDIEVNQNLKKNALKELFMKSFNRKGILIIVCLKLTQLMSGKAAIVSYTEEIFTVSGSSIHPKVSVLILAAVRLTVSCISCGIMDRVSKRLIFLISGILASFFLSIVGLFFYLKIYIRADISSITWLPLAGLILFEVVYYLGIDVVPYVIQGEIFSIKVKGVAVAGGMMFGSVCSFVTTLGYYALSSGAGVYTAFWFFSFVAIFGSVLSFLITSETNGKTLEEIQAMQNPEMRKKLSSERCTKVEENNIH